MSDSRYERLTKIYAMLEQVRGAEVAAARRAVLRLEGEIRLKRAEIRAAAGKTRVCGSIDFAVSAASTKYAVAVLANCQAKKRILQDELTAAESAYGLARLQLEQMKCLKEGAEATWLRADNRRVQGVADDRFAGQTWMRQLSDSKE